MKKYDLVFITNLSPFYKINLYNEIAKKTKIFVIFMSKTSNCRNEDFFKGEKNFEYIYLNEDCYESRNSIKNSFKLIKILFSIEYKKIIMGGWDSLENWVAWTLSKKSKNCVVVESSEFESINYGIKGFLKKQFMKRITLGFTSGNSQSNLLKNLDYEGKIIKTKGVGIFNYEKKNLEIKKNNQIKNFIFVGRLSQEKNIEQLITVFNQLKDFNLNIVGYGPLEEKLKKKSKDNIKFLGKINNGDLSEIYQKNDVFILPSKSEPWGLVVEEALYNGLPVILSNRVGCAYEVIKNGVHGEIYDVNSDVELKKKIENISKIENYKKYKNNVENIDFKKVMEEQINSYVEIN